MRYQGRFGSSPYPYAGTYDNISSSWVSNGVDFSSSGDRGYSKGLYKDGREGYYAFEDMQGKYGGYGYYRGLI